MNNVTDFSTLTKEELIKQLTALKDAQKAKILIKVSTKGGVQINGIRRFPVTFYKEEWNQIIELIPQVQQFIADHNAELSSKGDAVTETA